MEKLKNKLWIWAHPTNSIKNCAGVTKTSLTTPVGGMRELGATGLMYVPMGRPCDRPARNAEMWDVEQTGWSIESEQDVLDLIAQKEEWPNIKLGVFDDFFSDANAEHNFSQYSVGKMIEMREKLHAAGLEMWVVFYTMQIELDVWKEYLKVFDGVSLWLWEEPTNAEFEEKCQWFFSQTEGQKRMIGCYLYDFGRQQEATVDSVLYQLNRNLDFVKEGKIDGIILHTNAVGGLGFAAYDAGKEWAAKHGDDMV